MRNVDICIIGAGPAGLTAALECRRNGISDILILERDRWMGGILNQCIHSGFGLSFFSEELTGPEYAGRLMEMVGKENIPVMTDTMVTDLSRDLVITAMNTSEGVFRIRARAVILAMGCRERTRGMLGIPGDRPAGVYTAGTAQRLVNVEGYLPGKEIVILGSGDIGLIMARRMTLEGAVVRGVYEVMDRPGGLRRNIVQCLEDFSIPLHLSTTAVAIHGRERVEGVTVARVDSSLRPVAGTGEYVPCDTVLLSVGLIPENEITKRAGITLDRRTGGPVVDSSFMTDLPGVFAAGNVVRVYDTADNVSMDSIKAARGASLYVKGGF